jgi:hypothetical protein
MVEPAPQLGDDLMAVIFAWICAAVAAVATLGAAYFFDKSAEEGIEHARTEAAHATEAAGKANQRAAELEKETAVAKSQIAQANARANESALKLEQLRRGVAPRMLDYDDFLQRIKNVPKVPVDVWVLQENAEAFSLAQQIKGYLQTAGWSVEGLTPIPEPHATPENPLGHLLPRPNSLGAQAYGITLQMSGAGPSSRDVATSMDGLGGALAHAVGAVSMTATTSSVPEGRLRIVVATKQDPMLPPPKTP